MAALPEPPSDSRPPYWNHWRHDLWTRAIAEPAEDFMAWPCIRHTMLVQHFDVTWQFDILRPRLDRWTAALQAPKVGRPMDFHDGSVMSRNMVNQACHLELWEQATGRSIEDLDCAFEFGGGFGAMALLVRRMGFRGRYVIFDLPEFSLLQRWFLSEHGYEAEHVTDAAEVPEQADLFLGVYSISEIPPDQRDGFTDGIRAGSYLLLYSPQFAAYDNLAWASRLMAKRTEMTWRTHPLPVRPDQYAIGWLP